MEHDPGRLLPLSLLERIVSKFELNTKKNNLYIPECIKLKSSPIKYFFNGAFRGKFGFEGCCKRRLPEFLV